MKYQTFRPLFSAATMLALAVAIFGQPSDSRIDHWIRQMIDAEKFDGGIVVARNGKVVYELSNGFADFHNRTPNSLSTHFPIASVTKTFVSTAILQQAELGRLDIDKSVADYLPGFPYAKIAVKNLLSHTSGLPSFTPFLGERRRADPKLILSNPDLLEAVVADPKPLLFEPGTKWQYDNVNFAFLALILEKVSGESYSTYIKRHILEPAGMRETTFIANIYDPAQRKVKGMAMPHWFARLSDDRPTRGDKIPYVNDYWHTYQLYGFGDLISTTRDLLKYDAALRGNELLTPKSQALAATVFMLNDGQKNAGRYGLGWNVSEDSELGIRMFHEGASIGLSSVLYRSLDRDITIVVYDVCHQNALHIAWSVFNIMAGKNPPVVKKDAARTFGRLLAVKGRSAAIGDSTLKDRSKYDFDKQQFLLLGYELLGARDPFHFGLKPETAQAVAVFKFGLEAFPDDVDMLVGYGDSLTQSGASEAAIQIFKRAIKLDPKSESARKSLDKIQNQKP